MAQGPQGLSRGAPEQRDIALDWLRGQPIEVEEGKAIGLKKSELLPDDAPQASRTEAAFGRLRDLLAVGALVRPFVFCFDQTELYGSSAPLARQFGVVLSRLIRECRNHVTVATGNEQVWTQKLEAHFEHADREVLERADARTRLDGVDRQMAEALLRVRLKPNPVPELRHFGFEWLDEFFSGVKEHKSAREVIREAARRWGEADRDPPISEVFEAFEESYWRLPKNSSSTLASSSGSPRRSPPWSTATRTSSRATKVTSAFVGDGRNHRSFFGFEPGQHWNRWKAILNESLRYVEQAHHEGGGGRAVFFRAEGQKRLATPTRETLDQNPDRLRIVELTKLDLADCFAAHTLWAEVEQGDREMSREEVDAFLLKRFADLAWRVVDAVPPPPPPPPPPDVVERLVRSAILITMEMLLERLRRETGTPWTPEAVLRAAEQHASIQVYTSPKATVLQWIHFS
ncbi:MAG: hypothetical protein HC923_07060 [Myxococcales bacterium]|nr:hypothetical protein [Myxococcales bacterium]